MNFRGFAALPSNVTAERPRSSVMDTCEEDYEYDIVLEPCGQDFCFRGECGGHFGSPLFFYLLIFGSVNYTPAMMVNITADRRHGGGPWTFSFLFFSVRVLLFIC